jgi:hypothetical protein
MFCHEKFCAGALSNLRYSISFDKRGAMSCLKASSASSHNVFI